MLAVLWLNDATAQNYSFSLLAGRPLTGVADGTGTNALFTFPAGVALDGAGNIYVADGLTIRKVTTNNVVTTWVGNPYQRGSQDGQGTNATFARLQGIAADGTGNFYLTDAGNNLIWKVTSGGRVTTLAGNPNVNTNGLRPGGYQDGKGTNALFRSPRGIAVDGAGMIYVADALNRVIRKVTPDGTVTTLAGSPPYDTNGNFVFSQNFPDGTGTNAGFAWPTDLTVDAAGTIFVVDGFRSVRKITPQGVVTTFAGSVTNPVPFTNSSLDGIGTNAAFARASCITVDSAGIVYVGDETTIRKITPDGLVTTWVGNPGQHGWVDG